VCADTHVKVYNCECIIMWVKINSSTIRVAKRPFNGKLQRTSLLLSNKPNPRPTSVHLENWKKSAKIKQQQPALLNYPFKLYCVKQLKQKGKHDICRHTQSIPFGWPLNSKATWKPQTVLASKEAKRFQTSALFTPQTDLGWQHPSIALKFSMYYSLQGVSWKQETIILRVMLSGGLISGYIHIPDGLKSTKENWIQRNLRSVLCFIAIETDMKKC